jgi:hypothetical protein
VWWQEAAARRQFYQQELRDQILEQQRIREERKTREKYVIITLSTQPPAY